MINVLINGVNGRMGQKVLSAISENENLTAVCGVDLKENSTLKIPVYTSFSQVKEKVDVVIDFSAPSSLSGVLEFLDKSGANAVLCSTGYTESDEEKVKSASKKHAIFRSANMSLGVNVLVSLVKKAAKNLYGFDIEIIEKHHNKKKDAPSGTALMLANAVKEQDNGKYFTYGRSGICGERDKNEIGIHAIRGGNIVGEHEVIFAKGEEIITLSHTAFDRSVFANGAVKAAEFLSGKKNGLFNMQDMLGD